MRGYLMCAYFLAVMFFIPLAGAEKHLQTFTLRRDGYRLNDSLDLQEVESSSLFACLASCNQTTSCQAVSYRVSEGICLMAIDDLDLTGLVMEVMVSAYGWTTMSKRIYTVFHVRSPQGRYKATFEDAVKLCAEQHAVLASPADMLESRALGLDVCKCGWLSNRNNGFVVQTARALCSAYFNTGVMICPQRYANAWCRL